MQIDASCEGVEKGAETAPPEPRDFREEREELQRVLSHPEISRSQSLVRFLSYICNKYFDGEAAEIREYTIAVEALGRKESSFDSHIDPIVRVTARSLRKKLWSLYETDGRDHPLRIVLPLGHYVPQFVRPPAPGALSAALANEPGLESGETRAIEETDAAPNRRPRVQLAAPAMRQWQAWQLALGFAVIVAVFLAGFLVGRYF
jgi:hypothetical protein